MSGRVGRPGRPGRPGRDRSRPPGRPRPAGPARPVPGEARAPDPARAAGGWERRFIADRARAEEAIRLYREMGFEVAADPIAPDHLPAGCADCRVVTALEFRVIYTRKRPPVAGADERPRARRAGGTRRNEHG